ncbi:DPP IV N-terminal domain-containing protein [Myxococcus sp. K15C18031901]|uniref:S9 family peptidase n=1 Tax=Myxococcus dinghuensis TaxID=2906761 RepID=UPI0020A6EE55|nr:DPP IV N-terminal domain-containing protein [Myxococcus dinghuensis]MCP3104113.1 DPP IV N-terminal domain-containing protein [Myxococcus dinghuensis]
MRRSLVCLGPLLALSLGAAGHARPPRDDASGPTPSPGLQARLDAAFDLLRMPARIRDSLVSPRWLKDGVRLVFWSQEWGGTWALADARVGTVKPLLSGADLRARLSKLLDEPVSTLRFTEVALTPDERGLVFSLGGRVFRLGLAEGELTALSKEDRSGWGLSREHVVAPEGGAVAVRRGEGFAVLDAAGRTVVERAGESGWDWRIPEKAWSPEGRFLVVWRVDTRAVHPVPVVDYSGALEKVTWVPYAKTGTPLPRWEAHVVEVATGRVTAIAPAEGEHHDAFVGWWPDRSEALFLHLSRDGKRLDFTAVDAVSGRRRRVLREERAESFVLGLDFEVGAAARQVFPLPANRGFLWLSERDGWRHVYHYDTGGKRARQLTRGAFPVHEVVGVEPGTDALLVVASAEPGSPYAQLVYRGSLKGGALERVSSGEGIHRVSFAPSGHAFVDAWSSRTQPRLRELRSMDGRVRVRLTTSDVSQVEAMGYVPPTGFVVRAADGVTPLHGVLYMPPDFDAAKRYPVLAYVYGGPFINVVPWSYVGNSMSLTSAALARMGFVVVLLDPRGSTGRDKAFQDANHGRVGQTEIPDYVEGLKQLASTRPWMDLERVGIHGASWGGYFALRGMLTAPDFFKAGYAGAPGAMEEESLVNEPYLGTPAANPEGYAVGSNLPLAGRLQGHLKLWHGTGDVNAPFSVTMRMADALIRAGKHFELLVLPGQQHSPMPPVDRYVFDDVALFFLRTLGEPSLTSAKE